MKGMEKERAPVIAFLTSSPSDSFLPNIEHKPCRFREENGFLAHLRSVWPKHARCLLICAEPSDTQTNDEMSLHLQGSLTLSDLPFVSLRLCDSRNEEWLPILLKESEVVILSGGHTLTQNRFFHRLKLREQMKSFNGILLGISGGSMNCAETVYAQPERECDFSDSAYERFPRGLGLTETMILPHYQSLREQVLGDRRLIEDVAIPDSVGRTILALPEGSYLLIADGRETLMGAAFAITNGIITRT